MQRLCLLVGALLACCFAAAASASSARCETLDPTHCALPFPSDYFRVDGKLQFTPQSFPKASDGKEMDPQNGGWNDLDGFSPLAPILVGLGRNLDLGPLPRWWSISHSLMSNASTLILDAATLEPVAHHVELDHWSDPSKDSASNGSRSSAEAASGDYERLTMLWPASTLKNSRRYIVAFRNLRLTSGQVVKPSAVFAQLRDRRQGDADTEARRPHFEQNIFPAVERFGWKRGELVSAWDFTVGSSESVTGRLVSMRDQAFALVGSQGPKYRVKSYQDDFSEWTKRQVVFEVDVPLFTDVDGPGARLVLDENGRPVHSGWTSVSFGVNVPRSLADNGRQGGTMQYGHGLFGGWNEMNRAFHQQEAFDNEVLYVGSDWIGMAVEDVATVAWIMATDMSEWGRVPDRLQQGVLNLMMITHLFNTGLTREPVLTWNGVNVVAPNKNYYYGNSQGGIMGGVVMGVSKDIKRGVLGVPSMPYAMALPRSHNCKDQFCEIIRQRYQDPVERIVLLNVIQLLWDRGEPAGYAHHVTNNTLPGTPAHEVIIHHSLADSQTPWLGAELMGRAMGASVFESNAAQVEDPEQFGFPRIADSAVGSKSMRVAWDFWDPQAPIPAENVHPPRETNTHEMTRRTTAAKKQMYHFFKTGEIRNFCGGTCRSRD